MYKAPECYFGERLYTETVDIWAAGCIFFELIVGTGQFLLPANAGELGVLNGILSMFGIPTNESWPGI